MDSWAGPCVTCDRLGWFGAKPCRFEPRYDEAAVPPETVAKIIGSGSVLILPDDVEAISAAAGRTYVRDVCTACGKTIERQKP